MPSFKIIGRPVLEKKIFKGFHLIWPWWPSWSCDVDHLYKLLHTCDISLFRRELPIFCLFFRKSPYENFQNFLYTLYISLFGISDLPTKIQEFPSLFNHSPYLEKEISLFVFWDVSHVCFCSHLPRRLHMKFGFDWGFREDV